MDLELENRRLRNENEQLRALLLDKFLPLDWQDRFTKFVAESAKAGIAYDTARDDTGVRVSGKTTAEKGGHKGTTI